ncbi:hypothetical protein [Burkholderia sp. Ac-20349]|uniref:hypothetical protein n=1 Tax=Burkholderia sp. Ac-20349 TaxID=2703893 RepID=UPI00197C237D|nr:hypothetical protein [Burkholderia sp. Ac-20349]MBN3838864.1 hypothetical protein [Burkholderia sp. Ac-20349]
MAYFEHEEIAAAKAIELIQAAIQSGSLIAPANWWNATDPEFQGEKLGKFIGAAIIELKASLQKL